jgi:predicted lipoprotein with Yx(FWY)xxD motif
VKWARLIPILLAVVIATAASGGRAARAEGPLVLRVGDSVSRLTTPYLTEELFGLNMLNWDSFDATSQQSLVNLRHALTPATTVVAFDTGTNDRTPRALAEHLRQAAKLVGNRCLIVPTIEPPVDPGKSSNGKNRVVFDFATLRPRTVVPEWAGTVEMLPRLRIRAHGLHTDPEASRTRAPMIARAIHRCLRIVNGRKEPRPKPTWLTPVDQVEQALTASESVTPPTSPAKISQGVPRNLGPVVVNEFGNTLYAFSADKPGRSSACAGQCAKVWPPLTTDGPPTTVPDTLAKVSLLGTIERADGTTQVTYAGHPLYLYSGEETAEINGTGIHAFGGVWYPLKIDGSREARKPPPQPY